LTRAGYSIVIGSEVTRASICFRAAVASHARRLLSEG
jgi:hypothetical protein